MTVAYPDFADITQLDQSINRIVDAIRDRKQRAEFLFGAGMSAASVTADGDAVPMGRELSERLLRLLFPITAQSPVPDQRIEYFAESVPLEMIAHAIEHTSAGRRADLTRLLKSAYVEPHYVLSQAHHDLASISMWDGNPGIRRVFTTNFDTLLEKAFDGRAVSITDENAIEANDSERDGLFPVIHLHGLLTGTYQITEADVFDPKHHGTKNLFQNAIFGADVFVFVGYSMSDPNFRRVYLEYRNEVAERRGVANRLTFVVAPSKDRHSYDLSRRIWDARGAVLIPLDAGAFFARIKQILVDATDEGTERAIMKKFGLADRTAYEAKVAQVAEILRVEKSEAVAFLRETLSKVGA
jgi:hypothetical protein